jgi:hypothetical protein
MMSPLISSNVTMIYAYLVPTYKWLIYIVKITTNRIGNKVFDNSLQELVHILQTRTLC